MMIKPIIEEALNRQVNIEFGAFYSYLSMAAFFAAHHKPGSAHWFNIQAKEELKHAMKLHDYIVSRGGKVTLKAVEAPKTEWKSTLNVLEDAYDQELQVTALINELVDLAKKEHDHATEVMLQWFVTEQVEEEDAADNNVERLKSINNDGDEIAIFDRELGERK